MSVDIHKEDIPRKFVNPTLQREMVSIWDVVQLIGVIYHQCQKKSEQRLMLS